MDVNGTRFHLLLGPGDWAGSAPPLGAGEVVWSAERGGLALRPLLYRFPRPDAHTPADRRGAGRDGFGHFYHVGADERSIEIVTARGERSRWWPPLPEDVAPCPPPGSAFGPAEEEEAPAPLLLRGLAVTTHQYLVTATAEPAQLLVFDLHAGGPPALLRWPGPLPFRPLDVAPRPDGGLWLLEADPDDPAAPPRYWGLDRFFRLDRRGPVTLLPGDGGPFAPEAGEPADCPRPAPVTAADGALLEGRPISIEALPDGTVLVLEVDATTGATSAARYGPGGLLGRADLRTPLLDLLAPGPGEDEAPVWVGHDFAFVPDPPRRRGQVLGTLYVVGQDGNQAFTFRLEADEDGLRAAPGETYYPLRLFGGRGLIASEGTVYYDLAEPDGRWLPVVGQPKPRYEVEGVIETRPDLLDGREPGCVWHRIVMEACLPAGTGIRIESRAADTLERLSVAPWAEEPAPYLRGRGPELPYYRAFTTDELRRDGVGSWELLFQRAEGRYLQLRLVLEGTGRSTPRVHALRAYYPRFSYLSRYLPAVYREEEEPARFLDRFLANAEGMLTEVEGKIAGAEALFDERLLDAEYLDWLAGWFGTVLDPAFDEARRRLFLRHAVSLYAERGTLGGLVRALRLALDPCPDDTLFEPGALGCDLGGASCEEAVAGRYGVRVVEQFLLRRSAGLAASGSGGPNNSFTGVPAAPGYVADDAPWAPAQGATRLHQTFRRYLESRHGSAAAVTAVWGAALGAVRFPPLPPTDTARLADWRGFVADRLTFTYAEVAAADAALYRDFLERRYRRAERLSAAYGTTYAAFSAVPLPTQFPTTEPRLSDWVQFVSLVVPLQRNASRFDVLVPVAAGTEQAEQQRQLDFVRRLVEREKPAHTEFEVKGYWALFRVGEARLGLDTLLDRGSRFLPLLLPGALGSVTLGATHPWGVPDRFIAGRDRPGHPL